jgi:DNA topoisomerase-1
MELIVVESPTKAATLSRFLGKEYSIHATKGHIKDLPKSQLGVDIEHNFAPDYQVVAKRASEIAKITSLSKTASKVYLATDPDREGEAISQHVVDVLQNSKLKIPKSKFKRIVFHEITKSAVEEALAHPRDVDKNLVDAQIARRVLDRLVGYKLSPLLWKKVRRGLSAGRVQSVAVRLIAEREAEIEKFKPVEFWEIWADVKSAENKNSSAFTVYLIKVDGKDAKIPDEKTAKNIVNELENAEYKVLDIKKREVKKHAFPPFTTSTMTQAGARLFGWSSKRTMSVAQHLYEEGLITYHRTDSTNIAATAIGALRAYIKQEYGDGYLPQSPNFYKTTSKVAQEAHEGIRPTDVSMKKVELDAAGRKLYELIWRRFVASQMTQSIYDETAIDVKAGQSAQEAGRYLLRASGQIMKFDGWRAVMPSKSMEETPVILPEVAKDETLDLMKVSSLQKFTQPPARYNEASLIKTLEKLGIGRPSTYAPTISTIQMRTYVEKKDGKFFATAVGIAVNEFLTKNFPEIVDFAFTAQMEENLDTIADGKREWVNTIKDFYKPFEGKLATVEKNAERVKIPVEKLEKPCPECKEGDLVIRTGRFGKFISCSRFPECKYTDKYIQKIDMKCPECELGNVIIKKTGKGRTFYGCSRYPDCKFASWKNPKQKKEE